MMGQIMRRFPKIDLREWHGAMDRARRFADVAACRAVSNPAWCSIYIMFLLS